MLDMFGFVGTNRRKGMIAELSASLPQGISSLHPVEKATVLVLANSMLHAAERQAGVPLADNPPGAGASVANRALRDLVPHCAQLRGIVADLTSPNRRHASCHLKAAELACLTLGVAIDPAAKRSCSSAWQAAWQGRSRLRDAVVWIRRYEGATGVAAVPVPENGGQQLNDMDLARVGSSVPAFLRRRHL